MTQEDFQKHVLDKLNSIEKTQNAHREDFVREITQIKTEKKISAKVAGGLWGMIMALFTIAIKWLVDHFSK